MTNFMPGTVVDGRYRIDAKIGSGGLSAVYRALDVRYNRFVALKVLVPHLAYDLEFVRRFEQESAATQRLNHPNILKVYDRSRSEDVTYLVMEYVGGGSLQDRLAAAAGPLDPEFVLAIIEQVGAALSYAHAQGIIHRDIKPSNILIGTDGRVLLADFGLAQAVARLTKSSLTETGMILGTPTYMSPEQVMGQRLDARSDIYSLGIVLYQLLTGRVPFQGDTPAATFHAQTTQSPSPLRALNPRIPRALEEVVLRALEKDPARRYQSAGEFVQGLRTTIASYGLPSQPSSDAKPAEARVGYQSIQKPTQAPMSRTPTRASNSFRMVLAIALVGLVGLTAILVRILTSGAFPVGLFLLTAGMMAATGMAVGLIQRRQQTPPPEMAPPSVAYASVGQQDITNAFSPLRPAQADAATIMRRATDVAAFLVVVNGPQRAQQLPFKGAAAAIGRDRSRCEIVLDDSIVSRQHARIELERDRFYINDLGSANGTFVNGARVARQELRDRDEIRVGNTNLIFMQVAADVSAEARRRLQEFDAVWDDLTGAVRRE
jgi:pSer/pThr/pTyr-binding forkhead associated (FHA) protein